MAAPTLELVLTELVKMNAEIRDFRNRTEFRFESLESKMGSLDGRVGSLETKMGSLDGRVGSLETKMDTGFAEIRGDLRAIRDQVGATVIKMTDHERRLTKLETGPSA